MIRETLYTNDGHEVGTFLVPPWKSPVEVYLWGSRLFVRRADGRYTEAAGSFFIAGDPLTDPSEKPRATLSGRPPESSTVPGAPAPIDPATGMHRDYWVLPDEERAKGFVRPVRESYRHEKCGTVTTMGRKLAETYARDPKFYGATFCCGCRTHLPVGEDGEFVWLDGSKVGT